MVLPSMHKLSFFFLDLTWVESMVLSENLTFIPVPEGHEWNCPDRKGCPWRIHRCFMGASYSFLLKVTGHAAGSTNLILFSKNSVTVQINSQGILLQDSQVH